MAKKVVRLTEGEFMDMINEAVEKALSGMDSDVNPARKAQNILPGEESLQLQDFKGFTFKFFGKDGIGIVMNILFTFEQLTDLSSSKTILTGTVSFNNQSMNGASIIVNFDKGTVKYTEQRSRCRYTLEIDRRTKPQWDALLEQLRMALDPRP